MKYGNFRRGGRGKRRTPGTMNGLERAWSDELTKRVHAGELLWWKFEGVTLKLGPDCRYTPDFIVQMPDGELMLYETKGFFEEKAKVKVKVAVESYPFRIFIVTRAAKKDGGAFAIKEVV